VILSETRVHLGERGRRDLRLGFEGETVFSPNPSSGRSVRAPFAVNIAGPHVTFLRFGRIGMFFGAILTIVIDGMHDTEPGRMD
jgi:hypothetical protein